MMSLALPASEAFAVAPGYLNSAWRHPISRAAAAALRDYSENLTTIGGSAVGNNLLRERVRAKFAAMIGATVGEVAVVPSTVFAENLVLTSLGLPDAQQKIVTDALHFSGSVFLYESLRRQGFPVTIIPARGAETMIERYAAAITPGTRFVALSLVAATTGQLQDVAAIVDLAHARGALVYVDIIQAAGTTPLDVRELGADFCACATYKWLMGDMGAGFLYVRRPVLDQVRRPVLGLQQCKSYSFNGYPYNDDDNAAPCEWENDETARGFFEVQTFAVSPLIAAEISLDLLARVGLRNIEAHRQPLLYRARQGLTALGLRPLTPESSTTAILSFAHDRAPEELDSALRRAGVQISVYDGFLRISPSLFNDLDDVERLIEVMPAGLQRAIRSAPPSFSTLGSER